MRHDYESPRLQTALFRENDCIATEGEAADPAGSPGKGGSGNRTFLIVLIALLAVAAVVLAVLQPWGGAGEKSAPAAETVLNDEDLPLDTSVSTPAAEPAVTDAEPSPNIDPATGMELEEDELPILTP